MNSNNNSSIKQQQKQNKQLILNNFINDFMQIQSNVQQKTLSNLNGDKYKYKKENINFLQFFDLLIWFQKKQPQTLFQILQMDILKIAIEFVSDQTIATQIKAYIVLIMNCKIKGEIINYLLVHYLIDTIILKYLRSINVVKNIDDDQKLQYLGSLLKAYNLHLNEKTYPYYITDKKSIKENRKQEIQQDKEQKGDFFQSLLDFNTQNELINMQSPVKNNDTQIIKQKQCLLIKICSKFYNCPQQLTKTTVINILMNILRQPFARYLIYDQHTLKINKNLLQWSKNLCNQFRNQLKNFNQNLIVLKAQQQNFLIEQINDKLILWQDLTQTEFKQIYRQNFLHSIVYSLIVGSLNTLSVPLFNIKFTFYILSKMIKILINLDLLNQLGLIIFDKYTIQYFQSSISTAVSKCFNVTKILDDDYNEIIQQMSQEDQQLNKFEGTNEFFMNMLKSKDQQFLKISLNLIQQIIIYVKKDQSSNQQTLNFYLKNLGFGYNGHNVVSITSILLNQLKYDHNIATLKLICENIIYIQPNKSLTQENSNQFIYFYDEYLTDLLDSIDKQKQCCDYLVQTFQYDMKILEMLKFNPKILKDKQLLIHPTQQYVIQQANRQNIQKQKEINLNNKISFYKSIIQTPSEVLRYRIIKAFLLLKFKQIVLQATQDSSIITQQNKNIANSLKFIQEVTQKKQKQKDSTFILTKYVQKLQQWQKKQLKPGDILPLPVKMKLYHCSLVEQKTQIPCVLIQDDVHLILGFAQIKGIKIIVNVKFKHIKAQIITKKNKVFVKIDLYKFDFMNENVVFKGTILLRNLDTAIQYCAVKKDNFKQKQMNSIKKGLIKTHQSLPSLSLL